MKTDHLKNIFDAMKGLGHFSEYTDYQDYRIRKLGISESTEKEQDYINWRDNLPEADRQQYLKMFGE